MMLATLNAKLIGALSGESFLFIDRFVEMKKATSMLETKCVGYKSASQKCHLSLKILFPLQFVSHQNHCGRQMTKITRLFKYKRLQRAV